MPSNNPYTARLEAELEGVKTRRVQIRKALSSGRWFCGEAFENGRIRRDMEQQLVFLQREYERLHHELGKPLPLAHPVNVRPSARPAVRPAARPAQRVVPAYITKVIVPPGR
jgi:hypothetical protein